MIKKRKNNGNKTEQKKKQKTKILIEVVALSFFKCIIIIKHIIHLGTLKEDKIKKIFFSIFIIRNNSSTITNKQQQKKTYVFKFFFQYFTFYNSMFGFLILNHNCKFNIYIFQYI